MSDDPLYTDCEQCQGFGRWTRPPEITPTSRRIFSEEQCSQCDGYGMIFSGRGRQVLDIILRLKRNGRLN